MKKIILISFLFICSVAKLFAQDSTDIMSRMEKDSRKTDYTQATFKSTRVINGHSVENIGKGVLDVRILHRFAPLNSGIYNYFGLDAASMRMGFDYGITNNIMVGIGHSTFQKTYDALIKIKLLRQSTGAVKMPITLSFVSTIAIRTELARNDTSGRRILTRFGDKTRAVGVSDDGQRAHLDCAVCSCCCLHKNVAVKICEHRLSRSHASNLSVG